MHFIVDDVLGPVTAEGKITALLPKICLWESGVHRARPFRQWWALERFLYSSKKRNNEIVNQVFKDLRSSRRASILIAVSQLKHMRSLVKAINDRGDQLYEKKGEDWPEEIAVPFWRGMDRDRTLRRIGKRKVRVTVAIARMVQHGMDIPAWSHVYCGIRPVSSPPMFYQLANRCCTPYPKKKQPIVRVMVDGCPQTLGCFRKLFFNEILPGLKETDKEPQKYRMSKKDLKRAFEIARYPRSYSVDDTPDESPPNVF